MSRRCFCVQTSFSPLKTSAVKRVCLSSFGAAAPLGTIKTFQYKLPKTPPCDASRVMTASNRSSGEVTRASSTHVLVRPAHDVKKHRIIATHRVITIGLGLSFPVRGFPIGVHDHKANPTVVRVTRPGGCLSDY